MKSRFLLLLTKVFYKNKQVPKIFKPKSKFSADIEILETALAKLAEVEELLVPSEVDEIRKVVKTMQFKYNLTEIGEELRVMLCNYRIDCTQPRNIEWPSRKKVLELFRKFIKYLQGLEMVDNLNKRVG